MNRKHARTHPPAPEQDRRMRFEPGERQDDTRWTGEENKRLGQQSLGGPENVQSYHHDGNGGRSRNTGDGRMLSSRLELTVPGPNG